MFTTKWGGLGNKKIGSFVKVVLTWLVIVTMLIEAPLTLYASVQQSAFDAISQDAPAEPVAESVPIYEEASASEYITYFHEQEFTQLDALILEATQASLQYHEKILSSNNQRFELAMEMQNLQSEALGNVMADISALEAQFDILTAELADYTSRMEEIEAEIAGLQAVRQDIANNEDQIPVPQYIEELEALLLIAEANGSDYEVARITNELNQAWAQFFSILGEEESCGEPDCDCTPYWYGDDEPDDDFYDLDMDAYYMQYVPFAPFYEAPPAMMAAIEIAALAELTLGFDRDGNPVPIHNIGNQTQIRDFLNGTLGENHHHFRLIGNVDVGAVSMTGRPGVFTGVFCGANPAGGNFTVTGLRLRAARTAPGAPVDDGTIGVGFVQQAGHGAIIRNVNFTTPGLDVAGRLADFTAANSRHVGTVIGATANYPVGVSYPISVDNVHLTGARQQMHHRAGGASAGSWGGMVGRVSGNTTLNMRDVSVSNIEFFASTGTAAAVSTIAVAGGLVGSVGTGNVAGILNITTASQAINIIDVDMRGHDRGLNGDPRSENGVLVGGGAVGRVTSGHAAIYNTTVTSRRNINDTLRILVTAGGIVGASDARGTLRLNNVESQSWVQLQRAGGRVGGLVGVASGATTITNSRNYGIVQHQNNNATAGGLIGYTGASSIVVIEGSRNGTVNGQHLPGLGPGIAGSGFPGAADANVPAGGLTPGYIRNHHTPLTGYTHRSTAAIMGGIIGRSRGRVTINNTDNFGIVDKAAGGNATQGRNTSIGGIIGRAHPVGGQVVSFNNVTNNANVTSGPSGTAVRGTAGGIIGELMPPPRGAARVNFNAVENTGNIIGGVEAGGIIGWARPANVTITNAVNRGHIIRTTGSPVQAGGIIGRAGGAGLRIDGARNYGSVNNRTLAGAELSDMTTAGSTHSGGIVGRATAARLNITNVHNQGNVRGLHNAGGIVGFVSGNDGNINGAINRGAIRATRSGGIATAGGIVGRSSRRNMVVRNAGNFGNVTMRGGNNNADGVGGIIGRTHGANARVEISFNQGTISGRNSAGGIVGRNQGALQITDVYNIGQVTGGTANSTRSGNGIVGRRRTGAIRITRAWVSARVGGYAVATNQSGTGQQNANGSVTGITFSNVFVDETTFVTTGSSFTAANPATQRNRNGISLVDTEMLTSGFLPAFRGGSWRTGTAGVEQDQKRTYPYFYWQIPGSGLQQPFFAFIRTLEVREPDAPNRYVPVMDFDHPTPTVEFLLRSCEYYGVDYCDLTCTTCPPFNFTNTRVFDTYAAGPFPSVPSERFNRPISRSGSFVTNATSIGLISGNGVVGFETRDVTGRIVIRGFDPLFSGDPRFYISHTRFTVVSNDAANINLNNMFFECIDPSCPSFSGEEGCTAGDTCPNRVDTMRGVGLIRFDFDDDQGIILNNTLNPYSGTTPGIGLGGASPPTPDTPLASEYEGDHNLNFTTIRIEAFGYQPVYRTIHTSDLNAMGTGVISVPMRRIPFPIRVWIPQTPVTDDTTESDDPQGPPGTAGTGTPPLNARPGFPVIPNHMAGSFLAMDSTLRHTSNTPGYTHGIGTDNTTTVETGDVYPSGHFDMQYVMWGDTLEATAIHHTTNTLNQLMYEDLVNRFAGNHSLTGEPILDLDLYVTNIGLPLMYFRFVEIMGVDDYGNDIVRNLNIDGTGTGLQPNLILTVNNAPSPASTPEARATAPLAVHQPQEAIAGTGAAVSNATQQNINATADFQHFRVEGMNEESTFSFVDTGDNFLPLTDLPISDFFRWFYPLYTPSPTEEGADTPLVLAGNQAARESQIENAIEGDPILIRTLIIPLIRLSEIEVRIVEKIGDDYFPIHHSVLMHNDNLPHHTEGNGTFIIRDEEFNYLEASANGFIPQSRNYGSATITEIRSETGHIMFVLEREPANNPGYLEGFVRNRANGYPIENANIFVLDESGEIIYSRTAATDDTGFYSIRISDIPGFENIGDYDFDFAEVPQLRVMASYEGFAPNWSIHNPIYVTEYGATADVWLSTNDDDYLLLVTVICSVSGLPLPYTGLNITLGADENVTSLTRATDSTYWHLRGDEAMLGAINVTYTNSDYIFVAIISTDPLNYNHPPVVIESDYEERVASIVITRVRMAFRGVVYRDGTGEDTFVDPKHVLPGVTVRLYDEDDYPVLNHDGNPVTATTNEYGEFEFFFVPPPDGTFTIRITHTGYENYVREIPLDFRSVDIAQVEIPLVPVHNSALHIVVNAEPLPANVQVAGATVTLYLPTGIFDDYDEIDLPPGVNYNAADSTHYMVVATAPNADPLRLTGQTPIIEAIFNLPIQITTHLQQLVATPGPQTYVTFSFSVRHGHYVANGQISVCAAMATDEIIPESNLLDYRFYDTIFDDTFAPGDRTFRARTKVDLERILHTVSFVPGLIDNDNNQFVSQSVRHGETADEPIPAPQRENHIFGGWFWNEYVPSEYEDVAGTYVQHNWDFTTDTVTSDVTLYARWIVEVTFVLGTGEGSFYDTTDVAITIERPVGFVLTASDIPTPVGDVALGYVFSSWSASNPLGHVVAGEITFTANFIENTDTVEITFVLGTGEGSFYDTTDVTITIERPVGFVLTASDIPTPVGDVALGYVFGSWSASNPLGHVVAGDITFTANFVENTDTVEIIFTTNLTQGTLNGTSATLAINLPLGISLVGHVPTPVANEGWYFSHWTLNGVRINNPESLMVESGMIFTAVFVQDSETVTVLIRYFDIDEYLAGNTTPFKMRHVTISRPYGVTALTYLYTVPEYVQLPTIRYTHVQTTELGHTADVRYIADNSTNWYSMDVNRQIAFGNILGDGRDSIDVFFTRNSALITEEHVIVDVDGTILHVIERSDARTANTAVTVDLLTVTDAFNYGFIGDFEFVGIAVDGDISDLDTNPAARQIVPQYGANNTIVLVYRVQNFQPERYYVRHFVYGNDGERVLVHTNIVYSIPLLVEGDFGATATPETESDNDDYYTSETENDNDDDYTPEIDNDNGDDYTPETDNDNDGYYVQETDADNNDYYEPEADEELLTQMTNIALSAGIGAGFIGSAISTIAGVDINWAEIPVSMLSTTLMDLLYHPDVLASKYDILNMFASLGIEFIGYYSDSSFLVANGNVLDLIYHVSDASSTVSVHHYYIGDGTPYLSLCVEEFAIPVGQLFVPTPRGFGPINGSNITVDRIDTARVVVVDSGNNVFHIYYIGVDDYDNGTVNSSTQLFVMGIENSTNEILFSSRNFGTVNELPAIVDVRDLWETGYTTQFVRNGMIYTVIDEVLGVTAINELATEYYTFVFRFEKYGPVYHPAPFDVVVNVVDQNGNQITGASVMVNGTILSFQSMLSRWVHSSATQTTGTVTATANGFHSGQAVVTATSFDGYVANITITLQRVVIETPPVDDEGSQVPTRPQMPRPPQTEIYEPDEIEDERLSLPELSEDKFHERFIQGFPDGTFLPYNSITRAETVALFVRTLTTYSGINVPRVSSDISNKFSDVSQDAWYYDYIAVAYRYGLITGYPDGTFKPDQSITRQEFAAILARTTDVLTGGTLPYVDAADVDDWAFDYVYTALARDWMHGDATGTFRPRQSISRAEAVAAISRILGRGDTTTRSLTNVLSDVHIFPDASNRNMWYFYYLVEATNSHWFFMYGNEEVWTRISN